MPTLEPRLGIRAIRPLVSGLRVLGHDPAPHLHEAGIRLEVLADPDARVPMTAGLRLLAAAGAATGDDNLGLHLAEAAEIGSFDVAFYAMVSSPTLGQALERVARFQRLIHDTSKVTLAVEGGLAVLRHAMAGGHAAPRQSAEFIVAAWVRAGRLATGQDWSPLEVRFAHPEPTQTADHRRFFGSPVRFSTGENALVLPASLLAVSCAREDPGLLALLDRYATERLDHLPDAPGFADRARALLTEDLGSGEATATRLASRMKMSSRTLDRVLGAEGTSFRKLYDELRRQRAARALANDGVSISEVAFVLGFVDLGSFYRAFKRWTGQTPRQYRKSLAGSAKESGASGR